MVGLVDGKVIFNEKSSDNDKNYLEKIYIIMNKKILELKVNNNKKDLEKYIKPQWSLKTLISIVVFVFNLIFVVKDLEIDFIKLVTDSSKYFGDILIKNATT